MTTHTHQHSSNGTAGKRLALALGLTLAFVFVEAGAGFFANSLALLTDAAHNLTDVLALALSWHAVRLAARPASAGNTFGHHRAGILTALVNSTTLILISLGVFYEAFRRFNSPAPVDSNVLVGVGLLAFLVNALTAWLVHDGSQHDLNMKSAFVHLLGDVLATIGAVLAGIAIHFTGWNWLDPLVSVFIGLLILVNAWGIIQETVDILMEKTPADIDMQDMITQMEAVPGVRGVHDLHVWSITQELRALSVHILTDDISMSAGAEIQAALGELLGQRYHIAHATLQLECAGCQPAVLYCDIHEIHHNHG